MADIRRLPLPITAVWDWQMHGACRDVNSDLFFHPERERGPARAAREARATAVCRECPVLERCRSHALAVQEPYGVWGGLTEAQRSEQIRAQGAQEVVIGVDFAGGRRRRAQAPTPEPWPAA